MLRGSVVWRFCPLIFLYSFYPFQSNVHFSILGMQEFKEYWFCKNCEIKKHQCYVCWKLGDSDEALGPRRQVFGCDVASCGKFYHPWCVAKRLKPTDEREALVNRIRSGEESFTCPLHTCKECGKGEEKRKRKLNLATCRRCPSAWHLKCLPRYVSAHPPSYLL